MMNIADYRILLSVTLLLAGLASMLFPASVRAEIFTIFTYHDKPPYYENTLPGHAAAPGIYEEFVSHLNSKQNQLKVKLKFQPRKRTQEQLRNNKLNGAIIGVAPLWFGDVEQTKYLWSSAFMRDKDVVVTRKKEVFGYKHPNDLIGLRMVLPRGLYYWGVTELVKKKKITLYETSSDVQNLEMVLLGRADATITSILTYQYFLKTKYSPDDFAILEVPHDQFERMLLFPRYKEHAYRILEPVIKSAMKDPAWLATLHSFNYAY